MDTSLTLITDIVCVLLCVTVLRKLGLCLQLIRRNLIDKCFSYIIKELLNWYGWILALVGFKMHQLARAFLQPTCANIHYYQFNNPLLLIVTYNTSIVQHRQSTYILDINQYNWLMRCCHIPVLGYIYNLDVKLHVHGVGGVDSGPDRRIIKRQGITWFGSVRKKIDWIPTWEHLGLYDDKIIC